MTSSYLNSMRDVIGINLKYDIILSYEMYDVTGVNVFPRKLMEFPRKEKVNSVLHPLLKLHRSHSISFNLANLGEIFFGTVSIVI